MKVARRKRSAAAKAATKISRNVSKWDDESDGDGSDEDASSSEEEYYDDDDTADAPAPKRRKLQAKWQGTGADARPRRRSAAAKLHAKASAKRSRGAFEWHSESEEEEDCDARPSAARKRAKQPPTSKVAAGGKKASNQTGKGWFKPNDELWNKRFEQLRAYKEVHGDCIVPRGYGQNPQLGEWVNNQRRMHKDEKLSGDRVSRLEGMGFQWRVPKSNRGRYQSKANDGKWNGQFDKLSAYVAKHGHANVPRSNKLLGRWVHTQRTVYNRGKLLSERRERLEEIRFSWRVPRSDLAYVSGSDGEEPASEENDSGAHSESAASSPPSAGNEASARVNALDETLREADAAEWAETHDLQEELVAEATGSGGERLEQEGSDDEESGGNGFGGDGYEDSLAFSEGESNEKRVILFAAFVAISAWVAYVSVFAPGVIWAISANPGTTSWKDVASVRDNSGGVDKEGDFTLLSSVDAKSEMECATELKNKDWKEEDFAEEFSDKNLEDEEVVIKEETIGEAEIATESVESDDTNTGAAEWASVLEEEAQTSTGKVEVGAHFDSNPKEGEQLESQIELALDEESVDKIKEEIEEAPEGTSSKQEEDDYASMYAKGPASAAAGDVPVPESNSGVHITLSYHKTGTVLVSEVPSGETSGINGTTWSNAESPIVDATASDSSASNVSSGEIEDSSTPTPGRPILAWISVGLVAMVLVQCRAKNKVSEEIVEQLRQLNEKNAANDDLQLQLKAKDDALNALLQRFAVKNELVENLKAKDAELDEKMQLLDDNQLWFSEAQEIVETKDAQIASLSAKIKLLADQLDDATEVAQMWKSTCSRLEGEIAEMHERQNEGISELGQDVLDIEQALRTRQQAEKMLALVEFRHTKGRNSTVVALAGRSTKEDAKDSPAKAMSVVNGEAGKEQGNQEMHAASQKSDGDEVGTPEGTKKTTNECQSGSLSSESFQERKEEKLPPKNHPRHRSGTMAWRPC